MSESDNSGSDKIVGIDLGTTHSAIAQVDHHGRAEILPNSESERITPSVVLFDEEEVIVGRLAKASAVGDPEHVVQFIKREIGTANFQLELRGQQYSAEAISAMILKKLVKDASARLGSPVRRAVITVPAYFNDVQRKATQDAGVIAGLDVVRILDEPTAAALAFGLERPGAHGTYLVYDLGGGTFDTTVMQIDDDGLRALATDGDDRLGGKDWDDRIITHVAAKFADEFGIDPLEEPASYQDLLDKAEAAKIALSNKKQVKISCHHAGHCAQVEISRELFCELTADLLARTEIKTKMVLEDAGLQFDQLTGILLTGGSTRMPMVAKMLEQISGIEPEMAVHPDEAVALGAAVQGELIAMQERRERGEDPGPMSSVMGDIAVATVNAHALGVVARKNGQFENVVLIPRNTQLPCTRTGMFTTLHDDQQFIEINVLEGDATNPDSCVRIGRCQIRGLPARPRGAPIEVTYIYDDNGRIQVRARDRQTGKEAHTIIERDQGLDDASCQKAAEQLSEMAVA